VLGLQEKDRHLVASDGILRTVDTGAAAAGDAFGGQGFDPRCERRGARNVGEDPRARRRRVADAVLALEEEDRHLLPQGRLVGTVVAAAGASGNAVGDEPHDEVVERVRGRHVEKVRDPAERKGPVREIGMGHAEVVRGPRARAGASAVIR